MPNEAKIITPGDLTLGTEVTVSTLPTYRVLPQSLTPQPNPQLLEASPPVSVPTPEGTFTMQAWAFADGSEHLSATAEHAEEPERGAHPVRIHSECATGDIFGSYRCDCGPQLHQALSLITRIGGTLILVRNHEGRGIGLVNKLRAYALQDRGHDTVDANLLLGLESDQRDYRQAATILQELGHTRIRLISNNPAKAQALEEQGITVEDMIPDLVEARAENAAYLETKRQRMHHKLP